MTDTTHLAAEAQQPSSSLPEPRSSPPTVMEIIELSEKVEAAGLGQVDFARAVLARWGRPAPAPPADGEVAELVCTLTGIAHWRRRGGPGEGDPSPFDIRQADRLDRAAKLLQRQALVPVSVSERLPGPEDCDAKGRCWWLRVGGDGVGDWFQRAPYPSVTSYAFFRMTHWLPANALPLPEVGE